MRYKCFELRFLYIDDRQNAENVYLNATKKFHCIFKKNLIFPILSYRKREYS